MGPGLGADGSCGHFLNRVVADRGGGTHALFEIAGLDHLTITTRPMTPDPGETIGLKLEPDRECVRLGLAALPLRGAHLV